MVSLGIDIGGTFTDFVLETGGQLRTLKLLTTPAAPEQAVLAGVARLLGEAGIAASAVGRVVHGTTLATNALIERKGAEVGFLTTDGFRDTLEMGYENRYDQYDLLVDKPQPLVPRARRLVVAERQAADGRELTPLDTEGVARAAAEFARLGVTAVAVGFLHAFVDPRHEIAAGEILARALPGVSVCLASDVSPEIREFERFSTVCANAYIRPLMAAYLGRLADGLAALGIAAPLLLMQSNGGLCDLDTACRYPVRLLESGPAGGAMFAADIAGRLGVAQALLLDIGGTTAKLCLIDGARPGMARSLEVARIDRFKPGSGLPLRFPVVEMCEIGAGGGSLARVDRLGRLQVGPRSAGAEPGPACYGLGGDGATVTDAHVVLGNLDVTRFADGSIPLHPERAASVVWRDVGVPLGLSVGEAAAGIVTIVNERMATAAREHAIETGKGLEGADLARTLGLSAVVVPALAGVGSAVGFLRAPVAFEKSVSAYGLVSRLEGVAVRRLLAGVIGECRALVARADEGTPVVSLSAQMRYRGQGHELTVTVPEGWLDDPDGGALRALFEDMYRERFGRIIPGADAEVLGWTVRAEVPLGEAAAEDAVVPVAGSGGTFIERASLAVGARVAGPALIVDSGCTILVPGDFAAVVLPGGHLEMRRGA